VSEENKVMVRRIYDAVWKDHNLALVADHFASDFLDHSATEIHGPDGLLQRIGTSFDALPDGELTIQDQIAEGDKVVTRWAVQVEEFEGLPPTGKMVSITGIDVFRIAHGKIIEGWSYVNRRAVALATPAAQEDENCS
jgi:steroid delta-isomerase-like uncharacterized protein